MAHRSILTLALLLVSSPAFAAADLALSLTAPSGVHVDESGHYSLLVRNTGNKSASSVSVSIDLPETGTSPSVYIMGDLGARDARCSLASTQLTCTLGTLNKSASTSISFDIALPYSTAPIVIDALASTSSAETTLSNNSVHHVAAPLTYAVAMSAPEYAVNRHCTGSASLSSFFECELFPSSISSHDTIFNADGTITFVGAPPEYTGTWTQPSPDRLQFQYFESDTLVADFDGRGVNSVCFEGKTTFPGSAYISMYQVCI